MLNPKLQMLQNTLKRLMRRGAIGSLEKVVIKTHPADLAFLLPHFSTKERKELFERCPDNQKRSSILAEADLDLATQMLEILDRDQAVDLLHLMEPDDVSDLLESLPDDLASELLVLMHEADRSEVEELSRYDSATAGGIMSPRFFALHRDTTVSSAIEALHHVDADVEMAFYVYVVNEVEQLLGVVSLRQLVTSKPETTLFDIMTSDVIGVTPDEDQEEVAKLASRYGLLAIPVTNGANKLVGIVTIDDVIDVLREEATEDILRMAGAGDELVEQKSVMGSTIKRFPWLMATGVGGALAALMLSTFADTLQRCPPLVYFIPVLLALAGIIGLQSSTFIVQSIAQGRADMASLGVAFIRQISIGLVLGVLAGGLIGLLAALYFLPLHPGFVTSPFHGGLVIGSGVAGAMVTAAILGVLLPMMLVKIRVDPAIAPGPMVAISADLLGLLIYLTFVGLYF